MIVLDADAVRGLVTISEAANAIERLLRSPAGPIDPPRMNLSLPAGDLLVMPSRSSGIPTVKLVTVANDPDAAGGRIKGVHIVFDATTLAPVAVMDAAALTLTRTAAVSLTAMRRLARPDVSRVLVIGCGGQAAAHLNAILAEWRIEWVGVAGRSVERTTRFADQLRLDQPSLVVDVVEDVDIVVGTCDFVVCATTSTTPLFEGSSVRPGTCVVAIGTHTARTRELSSSLVARSFLVVEQRDVAVRESGNLAMPISEGLVTAAHIACDLTELVSGAVTIPSDRPRVFTSVGMAWQDAAVSGAVLAARGD